MEAESIHSVEGARPGDPLALLRRGECAVWLPPEPRGEPAIGVAASEIEDARARFERFAPLLAELLPEAAWDGRVVSPLVEWPSSGTDMPDLLIKADHRLPVTGTVKARGGLHEILCWIEDLACAEGVTDDAAWRMRLTASQGRAHLARHKVVVASTGNLGFCIGRFARSFGAEAEIHMSRDAKAWKKARLIGLGARVVEHDGDYSETVAAARRCADRDGAYFVDDERSRRLFLGYAPAAGELALQLAARGAEIGPSRPLVVYLPCGVGGAPGGVTAGLKTLFGRHVSVVWAEPTASACVLTALARGGHATSVYEVGLDNRTIADGLAVPKASQMVLDLVGGAVDAAVAIPDRDMLDWVRCAHRERGLRLEPSAAAGFAAVEPFIRAHRRAGGRPWPSGAVHVVWTTGGSMLPDAEFEALLASD